MSLNESIGEEAALAMATAVTRPLPAAICATLLVPAGEEQREAIRRLNPAIPEEASACASAHADRRVALRKFRMIQMSTERETTP